MSVGVLVRAGSCEDEGVGTLRDETIATTPTMYWPLSDASGGSAADASGNGLTGLYSGGPTLDQAPLLPGSSRCVDFDGTDDYVILAAGLDLGALGWTIQAVVDHDVQDRPWINGELVGGLQAAAFSGHNSVSTGGTHAGAGYFSAGTWKRLGLAITVDGPHIWHAIYDPAGGTPASPGTGKMVILRDGMIVAATQNSFGLGAGAGATGMRVGRTGDANAARFNGRMSDVAFWARPLDVGDCERLALAAATAP